MPLFHTELTKEHEPTTTVKLSEIVSELIRNLLPVLRTGF